LESILLNFFVIDKEVQNARAFISNEFVPKRYFQPFPKKLVGEA